MCICSATTSPLTRRYVDSTLKQSAFKRLEAVFAAFVAADTGGAPRDQDACERHLLVLRLFLTAAEWGRRRVGLSRLPDDLTAEPADLASAVLGMLSAERDATGVAPGDDTSPSLVSFGVDRVRECKATLVVESCVYAARAVAEAYECAGVLMLGIASSDATTTHGRDMARLHVVRQVAKVRRYVLLSITSCALNSQRHLSAHTLYVYSTRMPRALCQRTMRPTCSKTSRI